MNNPTVWAFLKELVQRLGSKNPKFFNILAWIGAAAAFITGLPPVLHDLNIDLGTWDILANKIVAWAGIVVMIMSNLATQRPVVSTNGPGADNLVKTDPDKLPFTAAVEKREAKKDKE